MENKISFKVSDGYHGDKVFVYSVSNCPKCGGLWREPKWGCRYLRS